MPDDVLQLPPRPRAFQQVDVFTAVAYRGNPLAVVLDGDGLALEQMQRFAHWTNLSETTFLLPPTEAGRAAGADYRVRIFDPLSELRFAGHPTLGSCHAWLAAGGQPQRADVVVQECQVGLVPIRRSADAAGQRLAFAAPPMQRSPVDSGLLVQIGSALGLQPHDIVAAQLLDNGLPWLGMLVHSPLTLLQLQPDHAALKQLGVCIGVAAVYPAPSDITLEVRAFAAAVDVPEDPVTGSLNASLAQWLVADRHVPPQYTVAQGTRLDRLGRVFINSDADGQVWVGGQVAGCISGTVLL